jgi:hypothetical protein
MLMMQVAHAVSPEFQDLDLDIKKSYYMIQSFEDKILADLFAVVLSQFGDCLPFQLEHKYRMSILIMFLAVQIQQHLLVLSHMT